MHDFIAYTIWPALKTRAMFWWWIVKYGGKKNIPRELLFEKISGGVEKMRENLMQAFRHMPEETTEEEKQELMKLLGIARNLEKELEETRKNPP